MRLITILLAAVIIMLSACGGSGRIDVPDQIPQQPTANSAGMLSGFGYSTAGEHYKTVHSLGGPTSGAAATSENERYKAR
ncbi:MAG: hypothetical protein ABH871_06530 [Pseudomonadota bacterium]